MSTFKAVNPVTIEFQHMRKPSKLKIIFEFQRVFLDSILSVTVIVTLLQC